VQQFKWWFTLELSAPGGIAIFWGTGETYAGPGVQTLFYKCKFPSGDFHAEAEKSKKTGAGKRGKFPGGSRGIPPRAQL